MGGLEQRGAQRFEVNVSAEVYTGEAVLPATTRNLSRTGVCLDLDRGLAEGTTVGVSLFLTSDGIEDPDVEALNVKAEVMWCTERDDRGFSAGARFDRLSDEHNGALDHFLKTIS
ncbi:MAG: PilZ domain-containing protein [Deltaproteobacteria bacterium]|nr:PilZ domain-containing protein [Deltaproteobacteria bacterium]